ncbi:uncharacterized protein [Sinocyclocheilus grahami]|uniref:uncharacterized protein n=1 Tax=Sinocyclocheilus grahami TaxID=75366 RepID=UPI0007ACAA87|nr:PREDICTED: uncharacterized protein LOC107568738 [Sinocyclocheilus grahami]
MILQYKASVIDKCKFATEYSLPSDERVDLAARYTEPVIIQRSKEQTEKYYRDHVRSVDASSQLLSNDKNHSIRIDQLFSADGDGNTPKTVILSGDSGRGKSFMLQKIMLDWASGELYSENFDVVFLLKCEELKCIFEELNLFGLLSWSCNLISDQISHILELKPEKVLILIDGIDEYVNHPSSHSMLLLTNSSDRARPMDILRSVLKGIFLPESFLLVTTRSIAADALMNLFKGPLRFTEIMGFSERGVQEYFQKFFQDEQLFSKTYESLKANEILLTACSVPLLCWMVCFCLKKHLTDDDRVMRELKTTTSIYVLFVSTLLEHHGHSQSVLTMLRRLGQRAEEGMKKREGLFVEKSVTAAGLDPATSVFLCKDSLKRNNRKVPVFKFVHLSFQEFFTGLFYVLLDEKESWGKVRELLRSLKSKGIISRPCPERRSNPVPSVIMFLCGLLNEKASSSLFEMIKWTVPHTIKLKTDLLDLKGHLLESVLTTRRQHGCELFALRCLYELQDEEFVRRALGDWVSMNLSKVSLRSTDCWVLLYCLQCCPHIRDLNLMYCDLTAEKLKILQPAFCMCETLRSVYYLNLMYCDLTAEKLKILQPAFCMCETLRLHEDGNSAESPRWSLNLSVTRGDVLLTFSSSFLAVLNISLTCPQSEISSTDWTLFLQRLSKTGKVAEDSSALDELVSLLLSSFHSVGLKTLHLNLVSLNKSWASGIISLVQICSSLQQLSVGVTGLLLEEGLMLLKKSLTDPHCTVIIEGKKCSKPTDQCKVQDWRHSCNEKVKIHFKPKVLEELQELNISEPSGLNLQPLPVCQSCVHIGDSDQWVQVEPSVCTESDEGGSEFRISTPAGRFECSRTRMRWVCAGDVTLQYRAVDGRFLRAELEKLQRERIGPVIDVTVISGKLEEAHLPHYACLAESDLSVEDAVIGLSVKDEVAILESVQLTRFHAKIIQPSFWPTTVIKEKDIPVEQHLDLIIFMTNEDPLILHVYFFPLFDTFSKEKIKQEETENNPIVLEIDHHRSSMKIQMDTPHILEVSGASVLPEEGIIFLSNIHPNFFKIKPNVDEDVQMTVIRQQDEMFVWKTIIWKGKLDEKKKEMRDVMLRLSTKMSKHNPEGEKRKTRKGVVSRKSRPLDPPPLVPVGRARVMNVKVGNLRRSAINRTRGPKTRQTPSRARHNKWLQKIHQYKASVTDKFKFVAEYNLPSDERVDLATRYTEPVIIQRSKEQTEKYYRDHVRSVDASFQLLSNDKNHSIRIDQLFSPDGDGNTPKTVILSGDSGRGKSFMLQKIMLDWASGELYSENFDVVFLLKCEELKCAVWMMNLFGLLSWSCSLTSDQISQILELTPRKVLILIDGIDEFSFDPHIQILLPTNPLQKALPMDTLRRLLNGLILPESFLLVTTRSAADTEMNLLKGRQRFTEIMGFSERGVQEYFQKFFQDEQLFSKTHESLKANEILLTACSVPLLCWMVCFCLKKHLTDDDRVMRELKTTTSIYVLFVSTLLEHHGHSQSVLTTLRRLGLLAEEGMKKQQVFLDEKCVAKTDLDPATSVFLYKDSLKRKNRQVPVFKFMHFSFQEFFTGLFYIILDGNESWGKVRQLLRSLKSKGIISRPCPERRSNPVPSVIMFLCGLLNEKASSSLFEIIKWTVPHTIKLKTDLLESVLKTRRQHGCELFALRCLYELQDEEFVRRALGDWVSMNLSKVSLRSTDCWVLLYCLQCCPHIRDLNLTYCDLTAEKLKILQPAFCMCETLRLSVEHLSEVGGFIQILGESKILKELKVQEDEYSAESPRLSLDVSVTHGDVFLSLSSSEKNLSFPAVLNISLTCPQSEISSTDWTLFLQRLSKTGKVAEVSSALDEHVSLLLSSFHSVGLKTLHLKVGSLNESWASRIISLVQTCTSLQQFSVSVTGLLLEKGLELLYESLKDPNCTVIIEGRKCSKPTDQCKEQDWSHSCNEKVKIKFKPNILKELEELNISEQSGLNLHPLPVCQFCVHIGDSDQWVQVEPSVCTDEGGSEFRISTPAGRFECSRTRMRWVCAGDVTLQYRAVDGRFLSAELETLQCERIGPVIDVTVISGKLEEAHLSHYACLAESDPSLKDDIKVLSVEEEGISFESVELTRFHAKILQPSFSPKTVLIKLRILVKVHCDLLIFMTQKNPIILHVYFFPSDLLFKEKIKIEEKSSQPVKCPRPETPLRMMKQHSLEVPGASVQPEAIKLRGDIEPNFFKVKHPVVNDINMTLSRVDDQKSVWTATIWKEELAETIASKVESSLFQHGEIQTKPQGSINFDKVSFFDRNWCALIKSVKNVNGIADKLLQEQVINEEMYSKITHPTSTKEESMREICSKVRKSSVTVKNLFIAIVQEEEPSLLNDLHLLDFQL